MWLVCLVCKMLLSLRLGASTELHARFYCNIWPRGAVLCGGH